MSYKELIIAFICIQFRAKVISVHKDDIPDPSIQEQTFESQNSSADLSEFETLLLKYHLCVHIV